MAKLRQRLVLMDKRACGRKILRRRGRRKPREAEDKGSKASSWQSC
jgi:hypothetical protein